jgi:hypothetical protein
MNRIFALVFLLTTIAAPLAAQTAEGAMDRELVHRSVEGFTGSGAERGTATTQQLKEQRTLAANVESKPRSVSASVTVGDHWIFDADAELFDDFDNDGYYRYLSVRFDADTYLTSAYVYAELYLSIDGETWQHYYSTEDFLIGGTVPDDEYFVETELVTGYPPGLYDVLIELYDADFGTLEDEFGPNESSALSLLPIEDAGSDLAPVQVAISTGSGGGGSMSILFLPLLLASRLLSRRRQTRD